MNKLVTPKISIYTAQIPARIKIPENAKKIKDNKSPKIPKNKFILKFHFILTTSKLLL